MDAPRDRRHRIAGIDPRRRPARRVALGVVPQPHDVRQGVRAAADEPRPRAPLRHQSEARVDCSCGPSAGCLATLAMILIAGQANAIRHARALGPEHPRPRHSPPRVIGGMVSFPIALVAGDRHRHHRSRRALQLPRPGRPRSTSCCSSPCSSRSSSRAVDAWSRRRPSRSRPQVKRCPNGSARSGGCATSPRSTLGALGIAAVLAADHRDPAVASTRCTPAILVFALCGCRSRCSRLGRPAVARSDGFAGLGALHRRGAHARLRARHRLA